MKQDQSDFEEKSKLYLHLIEQETSLANDF